MKNDPVSTYEYIFKDDSFTDNLLRHLADASVSTVLRFILNDNLDAIQDGIEGPEWCPRFTQ